MDTSRTNQQKPNDLGAPGQQLWRPDLPRHFLQPGAVADPNAPEYSHGLPLPGQHVGLNHLASAAAISDPYSMSSSQTSPSVPGLQGQAGPSAFIASERLAPGTTTTAAQQREQLRARRRVPSSQRKRTQVSCDACKTRRCKCVRLKVTRGADNGAAIRDEQPPCKLCIETGIPCVTTMPRKQRVYGSVENLDKRYRALEALVSGLFPDLNPRATAEELVAFGRDRGIVMPDFSESSDQTRPQSTEPLVKPETPQVSNETTSQWGQSRSSHLVVADIHNDKTMLPPSYLLRFAPTAIPQPSPGSGTKNVADTSSENTGLILDATGRPHYIGPCGSIAFFAKMRDLFLQRFNETASLNQSDHMGHDSMSNRGALFTNNPLAASLGGTGDRGRASGSPSGRDAPGSPSHNVLDHLDGDSPPRICESMLKEHPDDPEFWRYRKRVSMLDLPPKERADACVKAFFQYVHPNFILFHRLTFQRAYEKMWHCWESHRNRNQNNRVGEISVSVGWLCCLYMMFILGSRALPQSSESLDFQRKWFANVDKLPPLLGTSSLPNVCAYMLLSLYYHNTNDRTSAWTFHGAACRLAIALGMHRESASGLFDLLERQLRKLVWWTLYGFEQFLCCSLGRPSAIDDREMDVGIPNNDYLDDNLLPPRYIEYSARLDMLLAAVRRGIFDPGFIPVSMYSRALEFLEAVSSWEDTLPTGLRPEALEAGLNGTDNNQWRSATLLHIRYHHTLTFLTRPFLFETVRSTSSGIPLGPDEAKIRALSKVCLTAAIRCGNLVISLWRAGQVNAVTWIDIYYAYMSSLDISLVLLSPDSLGLDEEYPEIRKHELIQKHTVEEMKDVVRQLCDVMSTIDVCGTNARFAKAAFQFASALGIIPNENDLSLGLHLPDSKTVAGDKGSNEGSRVVGTVREDQAFVGDRRQDTDASRVDQSMTGILGYYPTSAMSLDFQGNLNYCPGDAMADVRWDM
ncbi:hypothetical protein F4776DRAFT_656938 [Hypoxylon sp. NC0597]|nr:hypothetical protein F4776DRAFT_656938 [Hypoxylon sp. NC0597]